MAKKSEWMGAFNAYEAAYKQIAKNATPAIFFVGVFAAVHALSLILQGETSINSKGYNNYADVLYLVFALPVVNYGLALASGKRLTSIGEFMNISPMRLLILIVTSILAGLLIVGSLLLLIVPVIWGMGWFAMAAYVTVDVSKGPVESISESKRISRDHIGKVWGVVGVSVLVSIAAGVLANLPYVGAAAIAFSTIWTTVASSILYFWLKNQ